MPKIDEQISYNWLFFLLAGAFGAVTFWAVWDEVYTRREWKDYQAEFFKIERKLADENLKAAENRLTSNPEYKKLLAERSAIEDRRKQRAAEIAKKEPELEKKKFEFKDKEQRYTFTKSELEETYYFYTLAKHENNPDVETWHKKWEQLTARLEEDDKARAAGEVEYNRLAGDLARLREDERYDQIKGQIEKLKKDVEEAKAKKELVQKKFGLFGLFDGTEVVQQDLEDIGRVDRCESCHLGASRGGFETTLPKYFASHPFRRTLMKFHPTEKFGCTTCHDGQGRATTKFYAHAPSKDESPHAFEKHFWEESLLRGPFQESNCRKCHQNEYNLRAQISCEINAECPKDLTCGVATGWTPGAGMPLPELGTETKPKSEAKLCVNAEGRAPLVELAPHLSRGRRIIEEVGCYGCHPMEGYDTLPKSGPDLRHVRDKLSADWMSEWIKWPKGLRPHTRMPNFFPEELASSEYPPTALPQFVGRSKDPEHPERWLADEQRAAIVSFLLGNATPYEAKVKQLPVAGNAEHGKELVGDLGCLGCHSFTGYPKRVEHKNRASGFDHGPDLGDTGSKTTAEWLFSWLRDPKSYNPNSRMPNLRLSIQEAADIATFLAGQKAKAKDGKERKFVAAHGINPLDKATVDAGKSLVKYYGCYGCHMVGGFETTPGIGVELTEFGVKTTDRLDFGDYIVDHNAQTWEKWLYHKLRHPRVYRYERVDTRMPQFDLSDEEIGEVMVVLKGMRGQEKDAQVLGHKLSDAEVAREEGRRLVRWYNCFGCHNVDNFTGDIRQIYPAEELSFAPPDINGEGMKTQPGWLFGFLKNVIGLRPWLRVRMPTFGFQDDHATQLVAMFSSIDQAPWPYRYYGDVKLEGSRRELAGRLFTEFKCQQCHVLGDAKLTEDQVASAAPNLLLAKERLRGEWIIKWLENPELLMPGTRMPSFFAGGANPLDAFMSTPNGQKVFGNIQGVEAVRKEGAKAQIELLRDYLMTMHGGQVAEHPEKTRPKKKAAAPRRADAAQSAVR